MTVEELLKEGIAAAKDGDLEQASNLFAQVVKADPHSEAGWLWLGRCRTVARQREYCFQKVLEINPQNNDAKLQLEILRQFSTAGQPQAIHPPEISERPPVRSVQSATTVVETSIDQPIVNAIPDLPHRVEKPTPQTRKKNNTATLAWAGAGILGLFCFGIIGIYLLTQVLLPGMPLPFAPTPTVTVSPTVTVTPTPTYEPVFESVPCDFEPPKDVNVTCGFIIVPEDRRGNLSDTIKLAVAIYHHTGEDRSAEPILYLQGGPGDEAVNWSVRAYPSVVAPQIEERDFIVFDPRGTGLSEPVLECNAVRELYLEDLQEKVLDEQRVSYYEGALLTCKNELTSMGVNISAYTSEQMAADARDVILALGYQKTNLYGISYGTRIAQLVMRDHPEVVRSAILDSVVPIETQMLDQDSNEQDQALRILFEDCKANAACSSAYPDLERFYQEAIDQLNANPIKVTITLSGGSPIDRPINGSTFSSVIGWMLRLPKTIETAPQMIYRIHAGDYSMLLLSAAIPLSAFDSISVGTYISVNCHDQVFQMSTVDLDKTLSNLCHVWGMEESLPGENDPVVSDIPTLIFTGRYDPVTPVSMADQLASHLAHGQVIVIQNQGHAPTATGASDCPANLMRSFLHDPTLPLDVTCVAEQTVKFAVPFDPTAPVTFEPVEIEQYQITTQVPSGWAAAEYGFYNRNGFSFGDVTQVGAQRAAVSEPEWIHWLMTNFRGNRGFDQEPIKYEERQANGLTWSLYRTTSEGFPVSLAFARSGSDTLMVLMITYPEEHDGLYEKVFLPILDSTTSSK